MSDGKEPPPGGGQLETENSQILVSDQGTMASAWASDSVSGGNRKMRTFEQILEDEKSQRNILEIQIQKMNILNEDDETVQKAKNLTFEDFGELMFDILKINPEDCISFNLSSGRYDLREIKFKPGVSTSSYETGAPLEFKNHLVSVRQQLKNVTRVTFKNVPLNVPDEEIINLCVCYGKLVDGIVHYETLRNINGRNLSGSTRFVDMYLDEGKSFFNYYWMEGPLPGDAGKRIVVLHNGQSTQCSNCLRTSGCPALGIGKACEKAGTPRSKMSTYMKHLRSSVGYVSLKIKHTEKQARMFPSLIGLPGEKSSEQEVDGVWAMKEDDSRTCEILNPIEERDKTILEQTQQIEQLTVFRNKSELLEIELEKFKAENQKFQKKLTFTRKATEERICENISNKTSYRDDPLLVAVLSATLNEDEIDTEFEENVNNGVADHISRKEQFLLNSLDSKIDGKDDIQKERLSHLKMQVIEKLRTTKIRKSSKRRYSDIGTSDSGRSSSKPRTNSP